MIVRNGAPPAGQLAGGEQRVKVSPFFALGEHLEVGVAIPSGRYQFDAAAPVGV
jgi:hypothetical protein